eukprot:jgi/Galph1/5752/GphlegSOOS_G4385.1
MAPSMVTLQQVREDRKETFNKKDSIKVIDNRTGQELELSLNNNTIRAVDLAKLGVTVYDPGFLNTASCISKITFIDGDQGILRYRGYPIEELAEKSNFMEVSFLLLYGELPNSRELEHFTHRVLRHTFIKESLVDMIKTAPKNAHPMGMLVSLLAAQGTLYPEANPAINGGDIYNSGTVREKQILRLLGSMPTLAAFIYRHKVSRPFNYPAYGGTRSYTENFMYMLDSMEDPSYRPNATLVKALDVLFVLHADHEQNCSTAAIRHLTSSGVDVFTAFSGAAGALYGPLHGGANEAVLRMLEKIGSVDKVPEFIEAVKNRKARLMGFGHRVYKNYDPRARIVRRVAYQVFDVCGKDPLIEIATALEETALKDNYFIERKLYPNVDFYSGLIYKAMGFPTDFFTILFAIGRTPGWLAHWLEYLDDPDRKIARPRQNYLGQGKRSYVPINQRSRSVHYSSEYVSPAEKSKDDCVLKVPNMKDQCLFIGSYYQLSGCSKNYVHTLFTQSNVCKTFRRTVAHNLRNSTLQCNAENTLSNGQPAQHIPCTFDLATPLNLKANWTVWNKQQSLSLYEELFYRFPESTVKERLETLAQNMARLLFEQIYPVESHPSVFIFCGGGLNGAVGMLLAIQLKHWGYLCRIVLLDGTKYPLIYSLAASQVPILSFVPSTIDYYADFVVDAVFGIGQNGLFLREPIDRMIPFLSKTKVPVVSLDIPSGWYVDGGPPVEYIQQNIHIKPQVLISFEFPKVCTLYFYGAYQYLVSSGWMPMQLLQSKQSTCVLPTFPKNVPYVLLDGNENTAKSNWGKLPGEIYGQGKPMPTLFSEPTIERWVDPEDPDEELWDELD